MSSLSCPHGDWPVPYLSIFHLHVPVSVLLGALAAAEVRAQGQTHLIEKSRVSGFRYSWIQGPESCLQTHSRACAPGLSFSFLPLYWSPSLAAPLLLATGSPSSFQLTYQLRSDSRKEVSF